MLFLLSYNSHTLLTRSLSHSHTHMQSEVESGYLQEQADTYGYVMVACNWWGMDSTDVPFIVEMITVNISNFRIIPDRLHQAMVNALSLMGLVKVCVCVCVCVCVFGVCVCAGVCLFVCVWVASLSRWSPHKNICLRFSFCIHSFEANCLLIAGISL